MLTISTYEPAEPPRTVESLEEFDAVLDALASKHSGWPLLVELSSDRHGAALVGIGSDHTTLEMLSADRRSHARACAPPGQAANVIRFLYAGEETEVAPEYLILISLGRKALRTWYRDGSLDTGELKGTRPFIWSAI
jgi:hypothetical protein